MKKDARSRLELVSEPERQDSESITVVGLKGILTAMAGCCNPLPGDEIVGFVTRRSRRYNSPSGLP